MVPASVAAALSRFRLQEFPTGAVAIAGWGLFIIAVTVGVGALPATAHGTPTPGTSPTGADGVEPACSFDHPEWRSPAIISGIRVAEDPS